MNKLTSKSNFTIFNKLRFTEEYNVGFTNLAIRLFFIFYVGFPIIISIIMKILLSVNVIPAEDIVNKISAVVGLMFSLIPIVILVINNNHYFWSKGLWLLIFLPSFNFLIQLVQGLPGLSGDIVATVLTIIIISFAIFYYIFQNKKQEWYNIKNSFKKDNLVPLFVLVVFSGLIVVVLNLLLTKLTGSVINVPSGSNQDSILQQLKAGPAKMIRAIFAILIVAPFMEEWIYRKIFFQIGRNRWPIIPISIVFFAFLHVQSNADWQNILPFIPLGVVNGIIYFYFKNSVPIIIIHFLNNLIAVILFFIYN